MNRPPFLAPIFENFPDKLKEFNQWALIRAKHLPEKGKYSKVPFQSARPGVEAKSNDPATWGAYEQARAAYEADPAPAENPEKGIAGVFFVLSESDPFFAVDFDADTSPDLVEKWVKAFDTYAERSPSGKGTRIFGRGTLPPGGRKRGSVEVYDDVRCMSVTGHHLEGTPRTIEARQSQLEAFHAEVWPPAPPRPPREATPGEGFTGDDSDLLAVAFKAKNGAKITALYGGDTSGYTDQSAADFALLSYLAFYCENDPARLDRLFRASGLMRDKWDTRHYANGDTYGQRSVQKALDSCSAFYSGKSQTVRMKTGGQSAGKSAEGEGGTEAEAESETRGPAAATRLFEMGRERFDLWRDKQGSAYASVPKNGHIEYCLVESTAFRDHLTLLYIKETGKPLAPAAKQTAVDNLASLARESASCREVYTRKADLGDTIYLDLCNDKWQVVEITARGWRILDNSPVPFRRRNGMQALPAPVPGGNIGELREFVNAPREGEGDDLFILMVSWVLAALGPHQPYPILQLMGEQGTAKSSAAKILRRFVDPNLTPYRSQPKEDRDLAISATNAFVVAYDNLSSVPVWLSDAFCSVSTGGGFGTRKLQTDSEEALFQFQSPILLTGIGEPTTRGDFLQRALLLSLPVIPEEGRRVQADVEAAFKEAFPRIFGALLDAVACGLRNLPDTKLSKLPRMADFARWISACEPACPWPCGEFLEAYSDNQAAGSSTALDGDTVAPLVMQFAADKGGSWQGTMSDLYTELEKRVEEHRKSRFPANAKILSTAIKRVAPALRSEHGIEVDTKRTKKGAVVVIYTRIGRPEPEPQAPPKSPQSPEANGTGAGVETPRPPTGPTPKELEAVTQEMVDAAGKAANDGTMRDGSSLNGSPLVVPLPGGRTTSTPRSLMFSLIRQGKTLRQSHGDDWTETAQGAAVHADTLAIALWWHHHSKIVIEAEV